MSVEGSDGIINSDSNEDPEVHSEDKIPGNDAQIQYKYSMIPRFCSTLQVIDVIDYIPCQNKFSKESYIKFFDSEGRLWENVREGDVIIIKNFPDKEDTDDFERLKRESLELNKILKKKAQKDEDISIR